jgi:hypothetical protein
MVHGGVVCNKQWLSPFSQFIYFCNFFIVGSNNELRNLENNGFENDKSKV